MAEPNIRAALGKRLVFAGMSRLIAGPGRRCHVLAYGWITCVQIREVCHITQSDCMTASEAG